MIETLLAYLIILLPSIVTLIGGVATVVLAVNKIRKNSAETQAAVAEAKETVKEIKSSETLEKMFSTMSAENASLKKALTLCTEEITRIHKLHPEWLEDGEGNDQK